MWIEDEFFEPRLLHQLINLRKLGIREVCDATIKILSAWSPVPNALEVLKLRFSWDTSGQIKLSSYLNIVKLQMLVLKPMPLNCEAFPPNVVKITLVCFMVDRHLLAVLKRLPKLKILKMDVCDHDGEKMDLSREGNGDSFPQLEVLHIKNPSGLSEVTCTDDVSMPRLKKLLLVGGPYISLSERLANLRI